MYLEQLLPELRTGARLRRTSVSHYRWIKIADPRKYPELEGDPLVYTTQYLPDPNQPERFVDLGGPFDTEEEAKSALTKQKKELTLSWKKYEAFEEARRTSGGAPVKEVAFASMPSYQKNALDTARIATRGILSNRRLCEPYIVACNKDNNLEVYCLSTADLLQNDWKIA